MTKSAKRWFRFEDDNLQATLIATLDQAAIKHHLGRDGSIVFDEAQQAAVMEAISSVRDTQFPWYLLQWKDAREAERYAKILRAAGLPFNVERNQAGLWFSVRREDRDQHTELFDKIDDPSTK